MRQSKKIVKTTSSRSEFNRAYKELNAECSYCKWHKSENCTNKWYGGTLNSKRPMKYPNWKLTSKNPKQWMSKKAKFIVYEKTWGEFYEWKF